MDIERLRRSPDPVDALRVVRELERRGDVEGLANIFLEWPIIDDALAMCSLPVWHSPPHMWHEVSHATHDALARVGPVRLLPWYEWRVGRAAEASLQGAEGTALSHVAQLPVSCHVLCNDILRVCEHVRVYIGDTPWAEVLKGAVTAWWPGSTDVGGWYHANLAGRKFEDCRVPECICIAAGVKRGTCPECMGAPFVCPACASSGRCPRCGVSDVECSSCEGFGYEAYSYPAAGCRAGCNAGRMPGPSPVVLGVW